jgi:hypothetical protein
MLNSLPRFFICGGQTTFCFFYFQLKKNNQLNKKTKCCLCCWLKKTGAQQNLSVKRLLAVAGGLKFLFFIASDGVCRWLVLNSLNRFD